MTGMPPGLSRRGFLAAVGTGLVTTTGAWAAAPDPLALVDPELRAAAEASARNAARPNPPANRQPPPNPVPLPPPAPQPVIRTVPGPPGAPDVRVMIIDGSQLHRGKPVYLFMHGGGFIGGRFDQNLQRLQVRARDSGCMLVSVEYRLAPATRFPGALEDNYAVLRWLHREADALGIDRARIAVGGDSAGGGHAAMLAIAARDRGEFPIAFQLLVYPMLDDRTGSGTPVPPHIGTYVWTVDANRNGWSALLGQPPGLPTVPPGSVPGRVEDLAGLPPAFIAVGGLDLFVEGDIAYARRLNAAGVPVELLVVPGAYHAFMNIVPGARVSRQFNAAIIAALRRGLGVTTP